MRDAAPVSPIHRRPSRPAQAAASPRAPRWGAPADAPAVHAGARAIERNVLIIPGNVFSTRDTHVRISYATTDEKLAEGCATLCALAG